MDAEDDPILADSERCVLWWGDVTKEDEAAIRMVKPGTGGKGAWPTWLEEIAWKLR